MRFQRGPQPATGIDPGRREALLRLCAAGALAPAVFYAAVREALAAGSKPYMEGIHRVEGAVTVNGEPAVAGRIVVPGDVLEVPAGGEALLVMAKDAFLARGATRLEFVATPSSRTAGQAWGVNPADILRLVTGRLLSVLGPGPRQLRTPTATIGIRGTGIYVEAEPDRSYVCTCYGTVDLAAGADPQQRETISTRHHEAPRFVYGPGAPRAIERATVFNHTDSELIMLESLVGRTPPFVGLYSPYQY